MKLHQQGNQIVVTELRPMSEVPNRVEVFMFLVDDDGFRYFDITSLDCLFNEKSNAIGWLPMPQYRPDAKHIDKAELYEKLRKLNPRQFGELFETHLKGDVSFDELVAKLP